MKKNKKNIITLVIMVVGILASITIFLPTMAFPNDGNVFSGIELVFGTEFINFGSWASGNVHFSILGVAAYILPVVASYCIVYVKKGYLYSIGLFAISLILLFLLPEYLKTTVTILESTSEIDINWVSLYGLIAAQVFVVIGLILSSVTATKYFD